MAANKINEILKHFPDLEAGWKEMKEKLKTEPTEREMLSLKYREMLQRESLKESLVEPVFTKSKRVESDSKVTSKRDEELEEIIRKYEQRLEKENPATEAYDFASAIRFGANWQKYQIMEKAVDVEVKVDAGGYPYIPQMELYDYDKDIPLAKEGDKYKVILIKEG